MAEGTDNSSSNNSESPETVVRIVHATLEDLLYGTLKLEAGKEYKIILEGGGFTFSL